MLLGLDERELAGKFELYGFQDVFELDAFVLQACLLPSLGLDLLTDLLPECLQVSPLTSLFLHLLDLLFLLRVFVLSWGTG